MAPLCFLLCTFPGHDSWMLPTLSLCVTFTVTSLEWVLCVLSMGSYRVSQMPFKYLCEKVNTLLRSSWPPLLVFVLFWGDTHRDRPGGLDFQFEIGHNFPSNNLHILNWCFGPDFDWTKTKQKTLQTCQLGCVALDGTVTVCLSVFVILSPTKCLGILALVPLLHFAQYHNVETQRRWMLLSLSENCSKQMKQHHINKGMKQLLCVMQFHFVFPPKCHYFLSF